MIGAGHGEVKTSASLTKRGQGGNNLGTSSQSVKPFTIAGEGLINTSIALSFDGLIVVKEADADPDHWAQAKVEYSTAIEEFDTDAGERVILGSSYFEGMATVTQHGNGAVTIGVPEQFFDDDFQEWRDNTWHNNSNLQIRRVVLGTAGAGEISSSSLTGNTRSEAEVHINTGRAVYYLLYTETFNFDAEGGKTYYVDMDLLTAANASDTGAGLSEDTFALADFSNTIIYNLSGGSGIATHLLFDGAVLGADAVDVTASNPFGGATSQVTLCSATMKEKNVPGTK